MKPLWTPVILPSFDSTHFFYPHISGLKKHRNVHFYISSLSFVLLASPLVLLCASIPWSFQAVLPSSLFFFACYSSLIIREFNPLPLLKIVILGCYSALSVMVRNNDYIQHHRHCSYREPDFLTLSSLTIYCGDNAVY